MAKFGREIWSRPNALSVDWLKMVLAATLSRFEVAQAGTSSQISQLLQVKGLQMQGSGLFLERHHPVSLPLPPTKMQVQAERPRLGSRPGWLQLKPNER